MNDYTLVFGNGGTHSLGGLDVEAAEQAFDHFAVRGIPVAIYSREGWLIDYYGWNGLPAITA